MCHFTGQWFDLHGIYYSNFGSDPQKVLPYLSVNTQVELTAINNNPYDPFAVAVFANGRYIGWVPSNDEREINEKFHYLLSNGIDYSAKITYLYDLGDGGTGATIYISFCEDYTDFDPLSVNVIPNTYIDIDYYDTMFLKYLTGKNIKNPKIAKYWVNQYEIIYAKTAKVFIENNLLTFSINKKNKNTIYEPTEYGKNMIKIFDKLQTLKIYELNSILEHYDLPTKRSKKDALKLIADNIELKDIPDITVKVHRAKTHKQKPELGYSIKLLEFLNGRSIFDPAINKHWLNDYNVDINYCINTLMQYGFLKIYRKNSPYGDVFIATEKGISLIKNSNKK